jgi:hypothetical protein
MYHCDTEETEEVVVEATTEEEEGMIYSSVAAKLRLYKFHTGSRNG